MEKVITGCVCHGISAQSLVTLERKKKKEKQNRKTKPCFSWPLSDGTEGVI